MPTRSVLRAVVVLLALSSPLGPARAGAEPATGEATLSAAREDILARPPAGEGRAEVYRSLAAALREATTPAAVEDVLIGLAVGDPDRQGLDLTALAVEWLGRARSRRAIPALVAALFVRDGAGRGCFDQARTALVRLGGPEPVDALLALLRGDAPAVRAQAARAPQTTPPP